MRRRTVLASVAAVTSGAGITGCVGTVQDSFGTTRESSSTPSPEEDVDGDGFTVCEERHLLDSAEVGRMDVFVEVDWTNGNKPDMGAMDDLVDMYDDAPVTASHEAEQGVNLHISYGEEVPATLGASDPETLRKYRNEYFTNSGRGYHYALFVEDYMAHMFGYADPGAMIIQGQYEDRPDDFSVKIFAHELGHSLGLEGDVFDGIDAYDIPFEEYPSMMNYVSLEEDGHLDFSDGSNSEGDFNDWGYLEENLYVPDKSELGATESC